MQCDAYRLAVALLSRGLSQKPLFFSLFCNGPRVPFVWDWFVTMLPEFWIRNIMLPYCRIIFAEELYCHVSESHAYTPAGKLRKMAVISSSRFSLSGTSRVSSILTRKKF